MIIPLKNVSFQSSSREIFRKLNPRAEFSLTLKKGEIVLTVFLRPIKDSGMSKRIFKAPFDEYIEDGKLVNLKSPSVQIHIEEEDHSPKRELKIRLTIDNEEFFLTCEDFLDAILVKNDITPKQAEVLIRKKERMLRKNDDSMRE